MSSRVLAVSSAVDASPPPHIAAASLTTSSLGFAIWWLLLFLLHGVNVAYYAGAAVLYRAMRFTTVDFQLTMYSIGIHPDEYYRVSTVHWVVAAIHVLLMTAMVLGSVQHRRLEFWPTVPEWMATRWMRISRFMFAKTPPTSHGVGIRSQASFARRLSSFSERSVDIYSSVFGREGFLGVDSVYFDHLLLARELLETTLQLIQVYRMTHLLPRVWLIRFYVVLLVANCWSTPLVHRYYRDSHSDRRMMSLLCDAVLDMLSSIGVSIWIFATYVPQYTDPAFGFPFVQWFDDVWFTNMQQEFQMMMVVSWADLASRLVFALGLLQCTESIKEMLQPVENAALKPSKPSAPTAILVTKSNAVKTVEAGPRMTVGPTGVRVEARAPKSADGSRWNQLVQFLLEKAGPGLFVVLGSAILVVHVVSETRPESTHMPCQLTLHPWFVNKPACSLVELDCHQLGSLSGSEKSMQAAWDTFESGATARLVVRHCPQLEMPTSIRQFRQTTGIKLYNCTIASWPETAALTTESHDNMRALFIIRSEFPNGTLPAGLLTTQFPVGLRNFVTSATNLRTLPDNLHELWPPAMTLSFERSQMQAVPTTVVKMSATLLSFAGSPIASVPPELFEGPVLESVVLSHTLIQELPRVVNKPSPALCMMFLEGTNISSFWSWMDPFIQYSLFFNKGGRSQS